MSAEINAYTTVQTWLAGVHGHSGVSPENDAKQSAGSIGEKRQKANYIRSFLIHNGVLLQTSPLT